MAQAQEQDDTQRQPSDRARRWRTVLVCGLLMFVGMNLRSVILAVPPVLPQIKQDLGLTQTAVGVLTALPVLVMSGAAWGAGYFAGRFGARTMVLVGLAFLAAGALLRAVWPAPLPLFAFTLVLSLGIALAQTSVPVLARQWFPTHIGLVSALFSNGLIIGETLAASLTAGLTLALGQHAWSATFVVWSVPAFVALILWALLAPPAPALARRMASAHERTGHESHPRVRAWHLGIVLGSGSLVYFGMNSWIPSYNLEVHRAALTPIVLAVLNAAQLPVSLSITPFAQRLAGRRGPIVIAGVVCLVAISGWLLAPAPLEYVWAAMLGGASAFVFVLGVALPPLLARREEVARLTGLTLTISYGVAFLGPLAGGWLWDHVGGPPAAFLPVVAASLAMIVLGALLPRVTHLTGHVEEAPPLVGPSVAE